MRRARQVQRKTEKLTSFFPSLPLAKRVPASCPPFKLRALAGKHEITTMIILY